MRAVRGIILFRHIDHLPSGENDLAEASAKMKKLPLGSSAGFGEGTPQQAATVGQMRPKLKSGTMVDTCS